MRVLVIGDDTRSFLAIVRSLGRQGWSVDAAPFDFSSPALFSRYVRRVHRVPPYSLSAERWMERLRTLTTEQRYDLIIPCDDRALIPLARHAEAFGEVALAVPNPEAVAIFYDKVETRRLALSLGIPVAPGHALNRGQTAENLVREFGLPFVLKPRSSYVLGQAGAKASVRIVRTRTQLDALLGEIDQPDAWLVEGFFHGEGCGLSVLADQGEIVMAFQHRRLAEASESGGSSVRVGEPIGRDLMSMVEAMARATRLDGVAMFEFRRDRESNRSILLEVNCRFWGSLPLAVSSGADFPAAAARMHVSGQAHASDVYRPGIVMRDLGGEYNRLMIAASDRVSATGKLLGAVTGLVPLAPRLLSGRGFDSYAADDPEPFRRERGQLVRRIAAALAKRLTPPALRRARGRAAVRRLQHNVDGGGQEMIILCHGNICRSPFAELLLTEKARAADLRLDIVSAGSIEREGRRSPREAVAAAVPFGVDLSLHRSRFVDVQAAGRAGALIVFDDRNLLEVRRLGFADGLNLLRLPDLIGRHEIDDPYGHEPMAFDRAYADIDRALDQFVTALVGGGRRC